MTSARHLSLPWARLIQTMPPNHCHLNIILQSKPGSSNWSLSLKFPHQNRVLTSPFPIRATCPAHLILLDLITRIIFGGDYRSLSLSSFSFLHAIVISSFLDPNTLRDIILNYIHGRWLSRHWKCWNKFRSKHGCALLCSCVVLSCADDSLHSAQPLSEHFYHILKCLPFQNFFRIETDQEVQSVTSN